MTLKRTMGPLQGFRILEFAGIGPVPFCGMLLADLGADVVRIDRKGGRNPLSAQLSLDEKYDVTSRGRQSVALDLKSVDGVATCLALIERADALFEGYRPLVMERLGLGPDECLARNERLVYGRMTGWGQSGPLAQRAGHDINYIALSGALHRLGRSAERPVPPLNLVGDLGGGALYLAVGMLAALLETGKSGKGQVVDAAMLDGAASLMAMFYGLRAGGALSAERGSSVLEGAAHFYDTYETSDGQWIAIGSVEPQFYAQLRDRLKLPKAFDDQWDAARWPELKQELARLIASETRAHWCEVLGDSDTCVTPVLSLDEAPDAPHNRARQTFVEIDGVRQPNAAPRFSRTPAAVQGPPPKHGGNAREVLLRWGFPEAQVADLISSSTI
jgi:alpha-methylacyl-CoA racemase